VTSGTGVNAESSINGKTLTVEIPDATNHRGHWIKVSYLAKLDNTNVGNWDQYLSAKQQIVANDPVISTAFANGHEGVPNTAHYAVYTAKSGEGEEQTPTYEDDTNTVTVTPKTTEVTVDKKWVNSEGQNMTWPSGASVEIELLQGEAVYDTKTLTSSAAVKFTDLPVYEASDKQYTVREKTKPAGYTYEVTGTAAEGFTVTNTMGSVDVIITKSWHDFGNEDGVRPSSNDFAQYMHLWADDVDVTAKYADKLTVADKGNTYEVKWTGLPKMNGTKKITYQVSEGKVPEYTSDISGRVESGATITNSHVVKITV